MECAAQSRPPPPLLLRALRVQRLRAAQLLLGRAEVRRAERLSLAPDSDGRAAQLQGAQQLLGRAVVRLIERLAPLEGLSLVPDSDGQLRLQPVQRRPAAQLRPGHLDGRQ